MARIRTIKPEFFTSEDIVSLSPLARLLYIAIWCEADKEGRLVWKPMTFKLRYFPGDACDIQALCKEIVDTGLVKLYGEGFGFIPTFKTHQHINPRESDSKLPDPCATPASAAPDVFPSARVPDASPRVDDAQGGREGKGKEGNKDSVPIGTGGKPPMSTGEIIFGYGLALLTNAGTAEKQARSFLGGLRKQHGDATLIDTLRECAKARPLQPLEWLAAALPPAEQGSSKETAFQRSSRERMQAFAPGIAKRAPGTPLTVLDEVFDVALIPGH